MQSSISEMRHPKDFPKLLPALAIAAAAILAGTFISEMRHPKDFPKLLAALACASSALFVIPAVL